jgi:hypothetical protein
MRPAQAPQSFDSAAAGPGRLMSQMRFEGVTNGRSNDRLEATQIFDRLRRQNNPEGHS